MIFNVLIIILFAVVVYFHWVQGWFSGVISAALATVAALMAVSYHESVAAALLSGFMGDYAVPFALCAIFAAVYLVGRVVFDAFVPGNVNTPLYADKVGGAVCGVIAAIMALGTLSTAAQAMPSGPTLLGFGRFEVRDRENITIMAPEGRSMTDTQVIGELVEESPGEANEKGMILPVDAWLIGFAGYQSRGGAMAGPVDFNRVHPDYLQHLAMQRYGVQPAAKHVALNAGGKKDVEPAGVFAPTQLRVIDGVDPKIRLDGQGRKDLPAVLTSDRAGSTLLVVRVKVNSTAADKDGLVRFSPGTVRLVAGGRDFYPIGTVDHPSQMLVANRRDDYLLANTKEGGTKTIDFAFQLDGPAVMADPSAERPATLPGTFLEFKRMARVDLSNVEVTPGPPPSTPESASGVLRTPALKSAITAGAWGTKPPGQ